MKWFIVIALLFPTAVMAQDICPSSFDDFLQKFERSREFQQANIIYPLKYSYVDSSAATEPQTVNKRLSEANVAALKKPIYPSPSEQKTVPFVKVLHSKSQAKKTIRLSKPDTGYVLKYHFEKSGECWKLVMYEDQSI